MSVGSRGLEIVAQLIVDYNIDNRVLSIIVQILCELIIT